MKCPVRRAYSRTTKFATFRQERSTGANMASSMPSPANGGQSTKSKPAQSAQKPQRWDVLNLTSTWFLTNDGTPVLVDGSLPGGATNDQWRELMSRTGVRMPLDKLNSHWGQYRRCAFLNWCEEQLSEARRPRLFDSRQAALDFSKDFDESKRDSKSFEISDSPQSDSGSEMGV